MNRLVSMRTALAVVMLAALAGCHTGTGAGDDDDAPEVKGTVRVTTTMPVSKTFHDTIEVWGSIAGDPRRASVMSLGHGGEVSAMEVVAGQAVRQGQPLLHVVPDPAARDNYLQAQSALELAQGDFQRTRRMATQHLVTQSQVAAAQKTLKDAQAALAAQRALGGGRVEETIKAPADGVVTALDVSLGERFQAGTVLLRFTPAKAMVVELGVQPEDGPRLKSGMVVHVKGVYGAGEALTGHIAVVGHAINAQTHLLPVQVTLPPGEGAHWANGTAVQASIETAGYTAWALPRDAVLHDDRGEYVFAADHLRAKRISVVLRHPGGATVGVQGPLDSKMPIVVLGNYELADGDALREQQEPAK